MTLGGCTAYGTVVRETRAVPHSDFPANVRPQSGQKVVPMNGVALGGVEDKDA
jgi:hypothetical protein